MIEVLSMADLFVTNAVLGCVGLRLVKRVDKLDKRVDVTVICCSDFRPNNWRLNQSSWCFKLSTCALS